MNPWLKHQVQKLGRSGLVGGLATASSVGALALMVQWLGMTPSQANAPSMLAGVIIQFIGNRYFVFHAANADVRRQLLLYILEEAITFVLNYFLFEFIVAHSSIHYTGARLIGTCIVFLGFSYPVWHWIFRRNSQSASTQLTQTRS